MAKEAMVDKNKVDAPAMDGFEEMQNETQTLPPMLALQVGGIADGILQDVALIEDEDKTAKNKDGKKAYRHFYRFVLLLDAEGKNAKGDDVEYKKGDVVSVPGSGQLDYQLEALCRKVAGQEKSENPKWPRLTGHRIRIERIEDDKLSKGKYQGKPVKCFTIGHSAPKGK